MKSSPHLMARTSRSQSEAYRHAEMAVRHELSDSLACYPHPWSSAEEGAMVLGEQVDKLWEAVKANRIGTARAEAAQVAAMAIRLVADVYSDRAMVRSRIHRPDRALLSAVGHHDDDDDTWLTRVLYRLATDEQQIVRPTVGPSRALASSHEAFGFLKRDYDDMWTAIRSTGDGRSAAVRVAAIAIRFIAEITSATTPVSVHR